MFIKYGTGNSCCACIVCEGGLRVSTRECSLRECSLRGCSLNRDQGTVVALVLCVWGGEMQWSKVQLIYFKMNLRL